MVNPIAEELTLIVPAGLVGQQLNVRLCSVLGQTLLHTEISVEGSKVVITLGRNTPVAGLLLLAVTDQQGREKRWLVSRP